MRGEKLPSVVREKKFRNQHTMCDSNLLGIGAPIVIRDVFGNTYNAHEYLIVSYTDGSPTPTTKLVEYQGATERIRQFKLDNDELTTDCGSFVSYVYGAEAANIGPPCFMNLDSPHYRSVQSLNKHSLRAGQFIYLHDERVSRKKHIDMFSTRTQHANIHFALYLGNGLFISKMGLGKDNIYITDIPTTIAVYGSTQWATGIPLGSAESLTPADSRWFFPLIVCLLGAVYIQLIFIV